MLWPSRIRCLVLEISAAVAELVRPHVSVPGITETHRRHPLGRCVLYMRSVEGCDQLGCAPEDAGTGLPNCVNSVKSVSRALRTGPITGGLSAENTVANRLTPPSTGSTSTTSAAASPTGGQPPNCCPHSRPARAPQPGSMSPVRKERARAGCRYCRRKQRIPTVVRNAAIHTHHCCCIGQPLTRTPAYAAYDSPRSGRAGRRTTRPVCRIGRCRRHAGHAVG